MSRYIGIDFGTKRVGVALSDESNNFALPNVVLKNDKKLLDNLKKICAENKVDSVVLGESKDFQGQDNPVMEKISVLKGELEKEGFKVFLEPEYMTSAEAGRIQGEKESLDASAAALILKSFLDKKANSKKEDKKEEKIAEVPKTKISFADFQKIEIKIGKIISAEKIAGADKLLKLFVDFGESAPRQIVSGIALYFPEPSELVGKKCPFVTNLEPRVIRGFESNGMIMAGSTSDGAFAMLYPSVDLPVGTVVK